MDLPKWSVRLMLEPEQARAITAEEPLLAPLRFGGVHGMAVGGYHDAEEGDGPWVTVDVEANNWYGARALAQHLVGLAFEAAQLRPRELPVAWVAPLADHDASSLRFLDQAEELLEQDMPDVAVVVAQMHLDAHIHTLVARAAAQDPSPVTQAAVRSRQWSLTRPAGRPLLEALINIDFTAFPRWQDFRPHVERRNQIAHGGAGVVAELARESIDLVRQLWLWVLEQTSPASAGAAPPESSPPHAPGDQLELFAHEGSDASSA
jgi:hypothetical protein